MELYNTFTQSQQEFNIILVCLCSITAILNILLLALIYNCNELRDRVSYIIISYIIMLAITISVVFGVYAYITTNRNILHADHVTCAYDWTNHSSFDAVLPALTVCIACICNIIILIVCYTSILAEARNSTLINQRVSSVANQTNTSQLSNQTKFTIAICFISAVYFANLLIYISTILKELIIGQSTATFQWSVFQSVSLYLIGIINVPLNIFTSKHIKTAAFYTFGLEDRPSYCNDTFNSAVHTRAQSYMKSNAPAHCPSHTASNKVGPYINNNRLTINTRLSYTPRTHLINTPLIRSSLDALQPIQRDSPVLLSVIMSADIIDDSATDQQVIDKINDDNHSIQQVSV